MKLGLHFDLVFCTLTCYMAIFWRDQVWFYKVRKGLWKTLYFIILYFHQPGVMVSFGFAFAQKSHPRSTKDKKPIKKLAKPNYKDCAKMFKMLLPLKSIQINLHSFVRFTLLIWTTLSGQNKSCEQKRPWPVAMASTQHRHISKVWVKSVNMLQLEVCIS